ncbi:SWR1-complex protein 4 [Apiospora saccharicola]
MTSHDVRDMLNLPSEGGGSRPTKKQKSSIARQNLKGLAREVQNLGGDNPIAIVPEISSFKKRRFGSRKPAARWEMRPFRNSARGDESLILRHWRRKTDVQQPPAPQPEQQQNGESNEDKMGTENGESKPDEMEDSSFAKFNVKVDVPQYSEDQYNSTLANSDWTKDETDYLMDAVRDYDLRWPIIWDRYDYQSKDGDSSTDSNTAVIPTPKTRTLEDLKARYYEVAAKMMAVQRPVQYMNQAEFSLHEIMVNFKPEDETRRKKFAEAQMGRSKEEAREEESLLLEVRRILARTEKFNQERRELYNRLDYPTTETTQDLSTFKTSNGLHTLLQNLMTADKSKKRKSLMGTDGQSTPASSGPTAQPGSTPLAEQRRESIAASASGHGHGHSRNDSTASAATDARPEKPTKKGAQAPERRKLTEQEELTYGVSTHDRLPSGPTFRYDRINKILTTKSNAQHARITNTLNELDVPARLTMPTKAVVDQMEHLLVNIQTLLDLKKLSDKFDAEIKLEKAKKAEKDKAAGIVPQPAATESATKGGSNGETAKENGATNKDGKKAGSDAASSSKATAAKPAAGEGANGEKEASTKADEKASAEKPADDEKAAAKEAKDANDTKHATNGVKQETGTGEEKEERPSSSGGQKRSASVLSSVSDKSAKRQKK